MPGTWLKPYEGKGALRGSWSPVWFSHGSRAAGFCSLRVSHVASRAEGKVFEEAHGGLSEASKVMAGGPLPMASVAGGPVPFSQLFGGVPQTTSFVGGLQKVMPSLPAASRRSYAEQQIVFGASMSCGGFAAFGDARGGLVAGNDPVVTEVEPGSACAGILQEPPETVEEINVDVPPERREDGMRTPRKRQAEREVFIGTPERDPEPKSSRVREVHAPSEVQGMPSMPVGPGCVEVLQCQLGVL